MLAACMALIDDPSDNERFLEIYAAYKDVVYDTAMSVLKNESLAEEAMQDTFLKIAAKIIDIPKVKSSRTASFVIIIAKNMSLDRLKKEHIDEIVPLDENTEDISEDILSKTIFKEGRDLLASAVNELKDTYSSVLLLKYVYDYDNDTIAQTLKIPKRTVETRIYRGKKILREKLEEHYGKSDVNK